MFTKLLLAFAIASLSSAALCQDERFQVTPTDTSLKVLLTRWAAQTGRAVSSSLPIEDVALLSVFKQRPADQLNAELASATFEDAIKTIFKENLVLIKDQEIEAYLDDHVFQTCVLKREVVVNSYSAQSCDVQYHAKLGI
ncbi:hypothetical protein BH11PSE11_BH11PSE11_21750 [soil metagenome]